MAPREGLASLLTLDSKGPIRSIRPKTRSNSKRKAFDSERESIGDSDQQDTSVEDSNDILEADAMLKSTTNVDPSLGSLRRGSRTIKKRRFS